MFAKMLFDRIESTGNPTSLGLDPLMEYIPDTIREGFGDPAGAFCEFNRRLIDALCDIVPAVKFQSAYYELMGTRGAAVLKDGMEYAKSRGMVVILDAKRNDIGSTAGAYAKAYLDGGELEADALTVNGYLGTDGIGPFLEMCKKNGKGIFVLVKTSNPSSGELQDMELADGIKVYEKMAGLVRRWGAGTRDESGYGCVGAVVGGTYPEQLEDMRKAMPESVILIPGYGAQGAGAEQVAGGFDIDGKGAIVNSSRGLMNAWKSDKLSKRYSHADFCEAAREEAIRMRDEINTALESRRKGEKI